MSDLLGARQNYFELFGLTPAFALDQQRLEMNYRELLQRIHPDRHTLGSDSERRLAAQWAGIANEAFQTLKQPLRRAQYLLNLRVDTAPTEKLPMAFLIEQMDLRENLQQARHGADTAKLDSLLCNVQRQCSELMQCLQELFDIKTDYKKAAGLVQQWQFLQKLGDEIMLALDELAGVPA
jgi:molecular chaperone HscB